MRSERRILIGFGAAALIGFLAGAAVPGCFCMGDGSYAGFLSLYSFGRFTELPDTGFFQLLPYLVRKRLSLLLFLWMSVGTPFGLWLHLLWLFWTFFAGGLLLALLLLREGTNGLLLFLCCLLPQWIPYAIAWKGELKWYIAGRRTLEELVRMFLLTLAGCGMETFIGLRLLQVFLKIV